MVALKTGIIRKPVPIIPIENNRYERLPASGFNAMAASLMETSLPRKLCRALILQKKDIVNMYL
jgi:hypothetical protein